MLLQAMGPDYAAIGGAPSYFELNVSASSTGSLLVRQSFERALGTIGHGPSHAAMGSMGGIIDALPIEDATLRARASQVFQSLRGLGVDMISLTVLLPDSFTGLIDITVAPLLQDESTGALVRGSSVTVSSKSSVRQLCSDSSMYDETSGACLPCDASSALCCGAPSTLVPPV